MEYGRSIDAIQYTLQQGIQPNFDVDKLSTIYYNTSETKVI